MTETAGATARRPQWRGRSTRPRHTSPTYCSFLVCVLAWAVYAMRRRAALLAAAATLREVSTPLAAYGGGHPSSPRGMGTPQSPWTSGSGHHRRSGSNGSGGGGSGQPSPNSSARLNSDGRSQQAAADDSTAAAMPWSGLELVLPRFITSFLAPPPPARVPEAAQRRLPAPRTALHARAGRHVHRAERAACGRGGVALAANVRVEGHTLTPCRCGWWRRRQWQQHWRRASSGAGGGGGGEPAVRCVPRGVCRRRGHPMAAVRASGARSTSTASTIGCAGRSGIERVRNARCARRIRWRRSRRRIKIAMASGSELCGRLERKVSSGLSPESCSRLRQQKDGPPPLLYLLPRPQVPMVLLCRRSAADLDDHLLHRCRHGRHPSL